MEKIRHIARYTDDKFRRVRTRHLLPGRVGQGSHRGAPREPVRRGRDAVRSGFNILIVSDRKTSAMQSRSRRCSRLSAIHQHLVRRACAPPPASSSRRARRARCITSRCSAATAPRPSIPTSRWRRWLSAPSELPEDKRGEKAVKNYVKAVGKGLLKVMSKMGISTYMSYTGAQIFEAVGLSSELVEKYFTGTTSTIEGIGLFEVAEEALRLHRSAFGDDPVLAQALEAGGEYAFRVRGEEHMWTPDAIAKLQHSTRANSYNTYKEYAQIINDQSRRHMTFRGLFDLKIDPAKSVPLDEVEPAKEIVKRFATGAMSLGSISTEAHTTLAIAMNRIGGKSNTGEGGEDPRRYKLGHRRRRPVSAHRARHRPEGGDSLRSIKQVASGRFGVTAEYLVNADEIQIKMAQGAKPGEGGQLPGHKVSSTSRAALLGARAWASSPAAAPRHLLDRGPGAAHPRPEERQPARAHQREAGVRRWASARSPRAWPRPSRPRGHLRSRRRHGRVAAHVDQARGHCRGSSASPRRSRRWC
jgi:glutamate synthase (NADPH/NADH) large chain